VDGPTRCCTITPLIPSMTLHQEWVDLFTLFFIRRGRGGAGGGGSFGDCVRAVMSGAVTLLHHCLQLRRNMYVGGCLSPLLFFSNLYDRFGGFKLSVLVSQGGFF